MTQLFTHKKDFNLKEAIEYLEFWKPIDGPSGLMIIWHRMGQTRVLKAIAAMGYNLGKINNEVSLNIMKKSFGKAGLEKTHEILLEHFRGEINEKEK